jgi:hypothetical protein
LPNKFLLLISYLALLFQSPLIRHQFVEKLFVRSAGCQLFGDFADFRLDFSAIGSETLEFGDFFLLLFCLLLLSVEEGKSE